MENASKALIIAASILLGIMLLTTLVYVFKSGAKVAISYDASQQTNQLMLYNSHFEQYIRDNNTVSDMISVCNLAYNTNVDTEYDAGWKVNIIIKYNGTTIFYVPNEEPTDDTYGRNKILDKTGKVKSIYDLTRKTLGDLDIIPTSKDYLTDSKIGQRKVYDEYNQVNSVDTNVTIYKYYFKCLDTDCTYNEITGRVSSMTFELYENNDYNYHS